jgi:polyphosphate glucokinase
MAPIVAELVEHFRWRGPIGVTFPAVVRHGVIYSAANVDKAWLDTDADELFTKAVNAPVQVVNDADAAGLAEVRFGAGRDVKGVVMVLTFGTGIGSGLFVDGVLVPNTELGHIEIDGHDAEKKAAAAARDREGLSWKEWSKRVDRYLSTVVRLFSPELIIVGGGVSRKSEKWLPLIDIGTKVVPAALENEAGIVGAALISAGG